MTDGVQDASNKMPLGSEIEKSFREREIVVKEREQATREADLELKRRDQASSGWRSPLVVAILAAAIGASGNAVVTYVNGGLQRQLEVDRAEQARLLEMIKTGNPDKAAENIQFLLDAGLVNDAKQEARLRDFLAKREPGSGPALPSEAFARLSAAITGPDDAMPTSVLPKESPLGKAAHSVGQLRILDRGPAATAACTAFLISENTVMTAGDCIESVGAAEFVLGPPSKELKFPVEFPPVEIRSDIEGLNYSILRLRKTVTSSSPLRLSSVPPRPSDNLALIMFRGTNEQLVVVGGENCQVVNVESDLFHHLCDSGSGSSGSPLLSANEVTVFGIHVGRDRRGGLAVRADRVLAASQSLRSKR